MKREGLCCAYCGARTTPYHVRDLSFCSIVCADHHENERDEEFHVWFDRGLADYRKETRRKGCVPKKH